MNSIVGNVTHGNKPHTHFPCWCEQNDWIHITGRGEWALLKCLVCGSYRNDPPPVQNSKEASDFYNHYYTASSMPKSRPHGWPRSSRFWKVLEAAQTVLPAKRFALDLGCGDGHLAAELKEAGWTEVLGVDLSEARIAIARRNYSDIQFESTSLEALAGKGNLYDLIVMDNVIEHLVDPVSVLRKAKELLAPSGKLVVMTPNMESGNFKLLRGRWTPEISSHSHVFLFTTASMSRLHKAVGLMPIESGTFHTTLCTPSELIWRFLKGDPKGAVWRFFQDLGGIYSYMISSGPMLFTISQAND